MTRFYCVMLYWQTAISSLQGIHGWCAKSGTVLHACGISESYSIRVLLILFAWYEWINGYCRTGSGCVITYAYQLLEKHGSCPPARATYYATDINPAALILAQATAAHNEVITAGL